MAALLILKIVMAIKGSRKGEGSMAKSKLTAVNEKIEKAVTDGFYKIEHKVVGGYTKMEDAFVEAYLTKGDETAAEAKERLRRQQAERRQDKRQSPGHEAGADPRARNE